MHSAEDIDFMTLTWGNNAWPGWVSRGQRSGAYL